MTSVLFWCLYYMHYRQKTNVYCIVMLFGLQHFSDRLTEFNPDWFWFQPNLTDFSYFGRNRILLYICNHFD